MTHETFQRFLKKRQKTPKLNTTFFFFVSCLLFFSLFMLSANVPAPIKLGRHLNDKKSIQLFHNVIFVIDEFIPPNQQKRVRNLFYNSTFLPLSNYSTKLNNFLTNNGGQAGDLTENNTNLYISNEQAAYDQNIKSVTVSAIGYHVNT